MLLREIPTYSVYFCVFETSKRRFGISDEHKLDQGGYAGLTDSQVVCRRLASGALSGCIAWTFAYPADIIKVNLQSAGNEHSSAKLIPFCKDIIR